MTWRRALAYLLAAGVGLGLAWLQVAPGGSERSAVSQRGQTPLGHFGAKVVPVGPSTEPLHSQTTATQPMRTDAANRVYAASGVTFEAHRVGDAFVGYRVLRSHDMRLNVGDVVTAVNGTSVEDSAAGGELLIAALRDPDVQLTLEVQNDWASTDRSQ